MKNYSISNFLRRVVLIILITLFFLLLWLFSGVLRNDIIKWNRPHEPNQSHANLSWPAHDKNIIRLRQYFTITSPHMVRHASAIANNARARNVDPYLIAAIGAYESAYYTSPLCDYGNCWGIQFTTGYARFASFNEGAAYVAQLLSSPLYAGKSIESISSIYCPPNAKNWARSVTSIYNEM